MASKKVCVVGAGVSGLVSGRELLREGHEVTVMEQGSGVGGQWLYDARTDAGDPLGAAGVHSGIYASLRLNTPREAVRGHHRPHPDGHGGAQDGVGGRHAGLLQHQRAVQGEDVDAGRLLEELQPQYADEDPAHAWRRTDDQLLPRTAVAIRTWRLDGSLDLLQASVGLAWGVRGSHEHRARVAEAPSHGEPPRRLRHGEHPGREEHGRDRADGVHDAPAQVHRQAGEGWRRRS